MLCEALYSDAVLSFLKSHSCALRCGDFSLNNEWEPHCLYLLLRFVLNELVQTEKDYVKDLGIVVEVSRWRRGCACVRLIWAQVL